MSCALAIIVEHIHTHTHLNTYAVGKFITTTTLQIRTSNTTLAPSSAPLYDYPSEFREEKDENENEKCSQPMMPQLRQNIINYYKLTPTF